MVSKMLVIKKISKEDPSTAFSAGFATAGALPTNGSKAPITGSSVYKNLVPKPAVAPTKVWLSRCFELINGLLDSISERRIAYQANVHNRDNTGALASVHGSLQ